MRAFLARRGRDSVGPRLRSGHCVGRWLLASLCLFSLAPAASANETLTYTYDTLGRLVKVARAGTVNNNTRECYLYDPASNRSNVTVSTSADCTVTTGGAATLTLSPTSLPGGKVGTAYSQTIMAAGGTAPYSFTLAGTLPSGLTLTSAGVLSGTPTIAGTSSFTVSASDGFGDNGSNVYSVTIASGPTTLTLSPLSLLDGTVGTAYSQQITATGGAAPYSFTHTGTLPAGLTLTSAGLLSGTPTAAGTSSFTVGASDGAGDSGSKTYSLTIGSGTPTTCSGVSFAVSNASANEGSSLNFTVTKSGTTTDSCSVLYSTADGTAVAVTNYTRILATTLTFASRTTSQTVTVATRDDGTVTGDLQMKLNLSSPSGSATISDSQGVGTIHNIDTSTVQPPTPKDDTGGQVTCDTESYSVTANDTDPGNNLPLSVVGVTGRGFALVPGDPTSVQYTSLQSTGQFVGTYTVQNTKGATATANLTITVGPGGNCTQ